ncbi:hypothetical protein HY448_02345 [Candidatus Pacearchaeota archaeon]|nr:hypothetical protein [Candidatus Pacearchaeota archaeon]
MELKINDRVKVDIPLNSSIQKLNGKEGIIVSTSSGNSDFPISVRLNDKMYPGVHNFKSYELEKV